MVSVCLAVRFAVLTIERRSGASRGYGATAARVTPDHKVGSSNLSGLTHAMFFLGSQCVLVHTSLPAAMRVCIGSPARGVDHKTASTQAAHAHPWGDRREQRRATGAPPEA